MHDFYSKDCVAISASMSAARKSLKVRDDTETVSRRQSAALPFYNHSTAVPPLSVTPAAAEATFMFCVNSSLAGCVRVEVLRLLVLVLSVAGISVISHLPTLILYPLHYPSTCSAHVCGRVRVLVYSARHMLRISQLKMSV